MSPNATGSGSSHRHDAIVLGAGHNGLTTAAYLARAGLDVLVLERQDHIGGATLTEEAFPGFHYSVFSYLVSLLRPEVVDELELVRHGLFLTPTETTLNPLANGDYILREADWQRTYRNLARHSQRDAEAYHEYKLTMQRMAHVMYRFQTVAAPDLPVSSDGAVGGELGQAWADVARHVLDLGTKDLETFIQMLTFSAADFLAQWFEHDGLKAALSTSSIIGSFLSPRSPGSAYVLLHHYMGEVDGAYRSWGFAKGGTGAVAEALAASAREHGAKIQLSSPVAHLKVEHDCIQGVVLENGDEYEATVVASSLAPQLSFLKLPPEGSLPEETLVAARRWDSQGCSGKVNLSLSEEPSFACLPGSGPHLAGGISISPSLDYMEEAFVDAKYGNFSRRPFIDMVIPSILDPEMAPRGQHVMSCFVQYAPYDLAEGTWDDQREAFGEAVLEVLEEYLPGLGKTVLHKQVLSPWDIEQRVGIPGGNIFHGELQLSQLFVNRPGGGASGGATPLKGYYVCGSSVNAGGGISGAPGRIAAQRMIQDLRLKSGLEPTE